MRYQFLRASAAVFALWAGQAGAQQPQRAAEPPRATKAFDPAAIRRQAAQIAEFRASLADPDPVVRLLTLREAIANGDAGERELAIDAGLASNESVMLNTALRGVLANTRQIVISFVDRDGKAPSGSSLISLNLAVDNFDINTGVISGSIPCSGSRSWSGQLQGLVLAFNDANFYCSGSLSWVSEAGEFRGHVNINAGREDGNHSAVWKPR